MSTCKVVWSSNGGCALDSGNGLCRVFINEEVATIAANAELGVDTGWAIQPVIL